MRIKKERHLRGCLPRDIDQNLPVARRDGGLDQVADDGAPSPHGAQPGVGRSLCRRDDLGDRLAETGYQDRLSRSAHTVKDGQAGGFEFRNLNFLHDRIVPWYQTMVYYFAHQGMPHRRLVENMTGFAESTVEDAALAWLESLGWNVAHEPDIAPDTSGTERGDYGAVVLERRLRDALETNDSAVQVFGDETLRDIARELVQTMRDNVTIDWTLRENVRANLRRLVKRILRKHGYPPDKQERATRTVLEQAEVLSAGWLSEPETIPFK